MIKRIWSASHQWAWVLMIIMLPITSMPLIVKLIGSDTVGTPSGIVLLYLVVSWLVPFIIQRGSFPKQCVPLLGFSLIAILSTAIASFLNISTYKSIDITRNELEALVTLGIGLSYYFIAAIWPSDSNRLKSTTRCLNWIGLLVISWSIAQFLVSAKEGGYPQWMRDIHDIYSVAPLYLRRVTGFTLEPSWLAHQLNMLFLPIWLASTVRKYTAHSFSALGLTFENLLLIGGAAVLILTFSRVGLLAFLLMIAYLFICANLRLTRKLQSFILSRWHRSSNIQRKGKVIITIGIVTLFIVIYLVVLIGLGVVLSRIDPRMEDLFRFSFKMDNAILRYANKLNFATRLIYWQAGWDTFNDYPWLGVGLGNAGFFFMEKMSTYAWRLVEVRDLVYRTTNLLNTKSLWVRLLAETGIVGFAFFVAWFYILWQSANNIENNDSSMLRMWALSGKLIIIGFFIEGFSIDSFAIPYLWFSLGLLTSVCALASRDELRNELITRDPMGDPV